MFGSRCRANTEGFCNYLHYYQSRLIILKTKATTMQVAAFLFAVGEGFEPSRSS